MATYLLRTPDLDYFPVRCSHRSLASDHVGAVTQHKHANEWVAIFVPPNNRLVVFPWATSNALIGGEPTLLLVYGSKLILCLLVRLHGEVDVSNLVIELWNQVDTCDLGDDSKSFRMVPCIV